MKRSALMATQVVIISTLPEITGKTISTAMAKNVQVQKATAQNEYECCHHVPWHSGKP